MTPLDPAEHLPHLLNDTDLLCAAEQNQRNSQSSAVQIREAQEIADGKLEVVVHQKESIRTFNFVQRPCVGFQGKTRDLSPNACLKKITVGRAPKTIIAELAAAGETYVIAATDAGSDRVLKERLATMKKAVSSFSNRDRLFLNFSDIDRLYQHLECLPSIPVSDIGCCFNNLLCEFSPNRGPWAIISSWRDGNGKKLQLMSCHSPAVTSQDHFAIYPTTSRLHLSDRGQKLLQVDSVKKSAAEAQKLMRKALNANPIGFDETTAPRIADLDKRPLFKTARLKSGRPKKIQLLNRIIQSFLFFLT